MTIASRAAILVLAALVVGCAALPAGEPARIPTPAATPAGASSQSAVGGSSSSVPSAAASASARPSSGATNAADDPLLATELHDVRTDETFTLASLAADAPVIVETMAIWCTNCRAQMHEVTAAHGGHVVRHGRGRFWERQPERGETLLRSGGIGGSAQGQGAKHHQQNRQNIFHNGSEAFPFAVAS